MFYFFPTAATLILATYLTRAAMKENSKWGIVGVLGWHLLAELVLFVHQQLSQMQKGTTSFWCTTATVTPSTTPGRAQAELVHIDLP